MKKLFTIILVFFVCGLMGQATYFGPNYLHLDNETNCVANYTILDPSVVGTDPSDILLFTHVKGVPGGGHDAIMTLSRGVWYDGSHWNIYNENIDTLYTGAAFNVLIIADFPTGISTGTKNDYNLTVFPNPATDKISVSLDKVISGGEYSITLSSMDGVIIIQKRFNGGLNEKTVMDVSGLDEGLYILTARTAKGTFMAKVNVVR